MDFTPTEAQQDLGRLTAEVCGKLVTADRLRELDTAAVRFDEPLWAALTEAGVAAATLPESVGGNGFGVLEQTAVLRELGKHVAAVPYLWSAVLGAGALAEFGSESQRELAGRALLTVALAEERNWGGVPAATARADGAALTVTGELITVPFAAQAERILVPVAVGDAVAVALIDPAGAGVTITEQLVVDRSPEYLVALADAPAELVGTVEDGARVLDWLRLRAWLGLAALQLGTLERALELVAGYAREREQFGKPVGSFQAVAQRLADAYIDIQGLRLAVTQAAWQLAEGLDAAGAVHTAKFWAAEAGHRVAHTVVHVHGGVGIDRDHIVQSYFIAAKHNEFALGGATDHLRAIGALFADRADIAAV
ncbi:acyl-CoA dehydrogenase family protein [Nocardia asteroides]|uniref:acyl-CoA dehydrogenase family protein n=1 Tax=Nocardia asteroides TaxID=1824 RepID=UPI001E4B247C|nr:acyl-CoA dehydrogenase family protein [Nocardia asteroides]UGT59697.1 acyl-CoA/acyl-ACP dehydrogenase [Nocardia asteroides]